MKSTTWMSAPHWDPLLDLETDWGVFVTKRLSNNCTFKKVKKGEKNNSIELHQHVSLLQSLEFRRFPTRWINTGWYPRCSRSRETAKDSLQGHDESSWRIEWVTFLCVFLSQISILYRYETKIYFIFTGFRRAVIILVYKHFTMSVQHFPIVSNHAFSSLLNKWKHWTINKSLPETLVGKRGKRKLVKGEKESW